MRHRRKKINDLQRAKFPRHTLDKALRIPKAILEQNAGKECTEREAAGFAGVAHGGTFQLEVSSAIKYGLLERPTSGRLAVTDLARKIIRPQQHGDEIAGKRQAVMKAPEISQVYSNYRGENLPDKQFLNNALADNFHIPKNKVEEFCQIFIPTLESAQLLEKLGDKYRVLDTTHVSGLPDSSNQLKKTSKDINVSSDETCFVMMPFQPPHGNYYQAVYEPAIRRAGLTPVRADNEIFGTGKIMDQILSGIKSSKVLVAELTTRNPNVFYELGLAHALKKPVVLVSSNENDVPFDLKHIRVIYYDVTDPFWGNKLLAKVAENILSAIKNPKEAQLSSATESASNKPEVEDAA